MWASLFTCSFRHLSLYNPVYFTLTALPYLEQLHFQSAVAPYICQLPGWTAQVWAVLEVCSAPFLPLGCYDYFAQMLFCRLNSSLEK